MSTAEELFDSAEKMGPPPAVRTAILRALAMNAEMRPAHSARDAVEESQQVQWLMQPSSPLHSSDTPVSDFPRCNGRTQASVT